MSTADIFDSLQLLNKSLVCPKRHKRLQLLFVAAYPSGKREGGVTLRSQKAAFSLSLKQIYTSELAARLIHSLSSLSLCIAFSESNQDTLQNSQRGSKATFLTAQRFYQAFFSENP